MIIVYKSCKIGLLFVLGGFFPGVWERGGCHFSRFGAG